MQSQLLGFILVVLLGESSVGHTKYYFGERKSGSSNHSRITTSQVATTGKTEHITQSYLYHELRNSSDAMRKEKSKGVMYYGGISPKSSTSPSPYFPSNTSAFLKSATPSSKFPYFSASSSLFMETTASSSVHKVGMTENSELNALLQNDEYWRDQTSANTRFKRNPRKELQIAVLAPQDTSFDYSLQNILPPITMAVTSKRVSQLLPDFKITVRHRDTQCSSTYGPLAAFDFYINKTAGQLWS